MSQVPDPFIDTGVEDRPDDDKQRALGHQPPPCCARVIDTLNFLIPRSAAPARGHRAQCATEGRGTRNMAAPIGLVASD
jgi:hypothetical protein